MTILTFTSILIQLNGVSKNPRNYTLCKTEISLEFLVKNRSFERSPLVFQLLVKKPSGKRTAIIGYFMGNKWLSFSSSGRSSETMSRSHLTRPPSKLTFSTAPPKDSIFCPKKNLEEPEDKKTLNFLFRDTSKGSHQSCPFNFEGISKSTTLNRHTDTQGVSFFVVARISHLLSFHM